MSKLLFGVAAAEIVRDEAVLSLSGKRAGAASF
jgi:hypothetical protein